MATGLTATSPKQREDTLPVLDYYRARPDITVHDINGMDTIDGVHTQILEALKLV